MATQGQEDIESIAASRLTIQLPRLGWKHMLSISIFWFALNFHWAALLLIILPSQVFKIAGDANKGVALAFVLVPGAFVSLFANPLFGLLSDKTTGKLATWGRRRPYILSGTLVNMAGLIWMAASRDIVSLALAYVLVQFSSNAAQAPFHALLPDLVSEEQRGLASGIMGLLATGGTIAGALIAGLFVAASKPLPEYEQGLWLAYGIIIAIMFTLMLITITSVRERRGISARQAQHIRDEQHPDEALPDTPWLKQSGRRSRIGQIPRSTLLTIAATLLAVTAVWGLMTLWNTLHIAGLQISGDFQQVILEVIATIGLLRLFDFNPRRDPDFAWVLLTRLVMMLGIFTIQSYLQYYLRDAVGASNPEQQTTNFVIIVSLTSLVSAFAAGWLSDRFGRKRMVYLAGGFMALVGLIFVVTHSLMVVLAAGAIFGLGYGAYQSVDWALVADVLPSEKSFARDMGVWNISLSLPQVIAPVIGGPIIDSFTRSGHPILGYQVLFLMAIAYCLIGTVTVRYIKGVKR